MQAASKRGSIAKGCAVTKKNRRLAPSGGEDGEKRGTTGIYCIGEEWEK